jgi:hypothetical protein
MKTLESRESGELFGHEERIERKVGRPLRGSRVLARFFHREWTRINANESRGWPPSLRRRLRRAQRETRKVAKNGGVHSIATATGKIVITLTPVP